MKIRPLGDRVVLKKLEAEETTKRVLPVVQKKTTGGRSCAVGPGGFVDGKVTMQVKVGEKVIISKYSTEVKLDGEEYTR